MIERLVAILGLLAVATTPALAQQWTIGGVAVVKPTYEGSDDYEVVGAPIIFPNFGGASGNFAFNGLDDIRYRFLNHQGFEAGVLGGYTFGRDEDDGDLLRGIGDVDGGLILGGYVGYRVGPALFDVSYHHVATGDDSGYYLRIGGTVEQRLSPTVKMKLRAGTTYADSSYMDSYFGISAAQSANSFANLAQYAADDGFKDVFVNANMKIDLTQRWSLLAGAGYKHLIGDAADSPIVESESQFSGSLGLTYKFSWQ